MGKKRPPVGIESFEKLRAGDFYYVDKTGMIRELLQNWGEVNRAQFVGLRTKSGSLEDGLLVLSELLCKHYGKKVIILIDEYDVPLQKAEANGYYREMTELLSQMFGYGMKSNDNMFFAVVTGCLRVTKESIFTGFNNPKVHTIVDDQYDEWFGFTDAEVRAMLDYYGLSEYYDTTKLWYDGYRFGTVQVYCPWDVVNWCEQLRRSRNHTPKNFWANTSSNDMVLRFVEMADETTRADLELLSEGKSIAKDLRMELTYAELDRDIENLWSVLFTTGYLTYSGQNEDGLYLLSIPNREIHNLFDRQIRDWFSIASGSADISWR